MSDIVERMKNYIPGEPAHEEAVPEVMELAIAEIERLRAVIGWVDAWTSNEVGSYSIYALDGLFKMTREKLAALSITSGIRESKS